VIPVKKTLSAVQSIAKFLIYEASARSGVKVVATSHM